MANHTDPPDPARLLRGSVGQKLYELAFEATPVGMAFVTLDRRAVHCNPALCRFLGRTEDELKAIGIASLTHPDDADSHVLFHQQLMAGEIEEYRLDKRYIHKDGRPLWAHLHVKLVRNNNGEPSVLLSQVVDINDRVILAEQLQWQAAHDPLTGLGNRAELFAQIGKSLDPATRPVGLAILYLDLDGFKRINDIFGHATGDRMLIHVAATIRNILGPDDAATRIGGDEFVLIARHHSIAAHAEALAGSILTGLRQPLDWEGRTLIVAASIGIAIAPKEETSPDRLLQRADHALYAAKNAGKDRFCIG